MQHFYFRILGFLKPYIPKFLLGLIISLIFTAANIMILPLIEDLVNEVSNKNLVNFNNQVFNAILLMTVREMSKAGQFFIMSQISNLMMIDMRMKLYKKLQSFSQDFFTERKLGDLLTRLFSDVTQVHQAVMGTFWEVFPQALTFTGVVIYLLNLNWKLTTFALLAFPAFVGLTAFAGERLKKTMGQVQRKSADITHIAQETLSNVKLVQAYTMEDREVNRFFRESMRSFKATMQGVKVESITQPVLATLQGMSILLVLWFGGYEVAKGSMTGPELVAFFAGVWLLVDPVLALSKVYSRIRQAMASVERYFEILDFDSKVKNPENGEQRYPLEGKVTIEDVSFTYEKSKTPVLNKINLSVKPGENIALVGLSGAGKTTLINLLPRFYDPSEGKISVDGIDLKNYDLKCLREQIGIVPQEDILFRGSILENVRYGRADASLEEITQALKKANAWEFVEKLPDTVYAKIGDKGAKLSGGQKQRISIARAILRNPKILILDEATSALDSRSEQLVQEALENLMKNRTSFVIAHRLSTVMHADRIVVLDKGRIVESGTHQELVDKKGRYAQLHKIQFRNTGFTGSGNRT